MATQRVTTQREPAIAVVCGAEPFLKRQAIQEIIQRVLGDADRSLALSEYEGDDEIELATVLDDLRTLPFLSERRLVVVRDADDFITRFRQDLEAYAESPSPTGVLLLECRTFAANTRLAKRLQTIGEVVECKPVPARAVPGWLVARAQQAYTVRLDNQAAWLLRELVGDDLGLLDSELQKLALYVDGRGAITPADVQAAVGQSREEQVWGILSAVSAGDQAKAMRLWEHVWETDRAAPGRAIGGLAFKARQLLNARRAYEAGASLAEVTKLLGLWDQRRANSELSAFTTPQVEAMLTRLLEADVAAKTGVASVQSSIEAFIIEMCRERRGSKSRV